MREPEKLRELALWYREFADRAGNSAIWDGQLRTAEDLEAEADRIERDFPDLGKELTGPHGVPPARAGIGTS